MRLSRLFHVLLLAITVLLLPISVSATPEDEFSLLLTKARKGNSIAQYNIGLAYNEGRGVAPDPIESYVWLSLALENGTRGRALDSLLSNLSNEQLATARQRLADRRLELGLKTPAAASPTPVVAAAKPNQTPALPPGPSAGPGVAAPGFPQPQIPAPGPAPDGQGSATPAGAPATAASTANSTLQYDKQRLSTELSKAWTEIDQLRRVVGETQAAALEADKFRRERDALSTKITSLAGDLATLYADNEQAHQLLAKLERDVAAAKAGGLDSEARAQAAESHLSKLASETENLKTELARARESIATLQAPRPAPENPALAQKERELQAAQTELARLQDTASQLNDALTKSGQDRTSLEHLLTQTQAAAIELRKQTDALKSRADDLEQKLAAANSRPVVTDLSSRVRELEAKLSETEGKLIETAKNANVQVAHTAQLASDLTQTRTELAAAQKAAAEKPTYPDLRPKIAELETQIQMLRSAAPAYPDERARVQELETALSAALAQLPIAAKQATTAEARASTAETALAKAREERAALERKLAAASADPAYPDLREQAAGLQKQLAAATTAKAECDAANQTLRQQLSALSTEGELQAKAATDAHQQAEKLIAANRDLLSRLEAASKPVAPAYPDVRARVRELEAALAAAKSAPAPAPVYPDLRLQVADLEKQLAVTTAAKAAADSDLQAARQQLGSLTSEVERQAKTANEIRQQSEQMLAANRDLQAKLEAASKPVAPAYPDVRGRVQELEAALAATKSAPAPAPAYPDLRELTAKLEQQLAAAQAQLPVAAKQATTAEARASTAETALAKANEERSALEKKLAAASTATVYPNLSSRVQELEAALAAAKSAPAPAPVYPDLRLQVADLEKQLAVTTAAKAAADSDLQAARQQLGSLTSEVERQAKTANEIRQQSEQMLAANRDLQAKLEAASKPVAPAYPDVRGRVQELETALAAAKSAPVYPDLSGRVRELEASLAAAKSAPAPTPAYPDLRSQVSDLEKQLAATQAQLPVATDKAKNAEARAVAAETALSKAGEERSSLEKKLAAASAAPAYPDLSNRVKELESSLAAAKSVPAPAAAPAYPDLRERVTQLETELGTARQKAAESDTATAALTTAQADKKQLSTELANAWQESEKLKLQLQTNATDADKLRRERTALSARISELAGDIASLRSEREKLQSANTELLETATAAKAQAAAAASTAPAYPNLTSRVAELEGQQASLQQKLTEAANTIAAQEKSGQNLAEQLNQSKAALDAVQATTPAYPDLRAQVAELEKQLAAKPAAAAPAYPDLRERVGELEAQAQALRNAPPAYPDLRAKVQELEASLAATSAAPAPAPAWPDLRERTAELEKQLTATAAAKTSADSELQSYRRQAEQLTALNHDLQYKLENAAKPAVAAAPTYPDLRERVGELEAQVQALRNAPPAYPDVRAQVADLEKQLAAKPAVAAPEYPDLRAKVQELEAAVSAAKASVAAAPVTPSAPDYPDLRGKVAELEQQLAAGKAAPAAPAYPDLRAHVNELELQLAAVQAATTKLSSGSIAEPEATALKTELADTKERLATSLRGYSLVEKERDELAAKVAQAAPAPAPAPDQSALNAKLDAAERRAAAASAEATRLGESLAALLRSTGENARDLASTKALLTQLQGTNAVLAQENLRLKTAQAAAVATLARPGAPVAAPAPAAPPRVHTVAAGDSLTKISQRYYANPARWTEIYEANRNAIGAHGELRVGSELRIP